MRNPSSRLVPLLSLAVLAGVALGPGVLLGCAPPHQEEAERAAAGSAPAGEGSPESEEAARISEWQKHRDAAGRDEVMSPFGAVDSQYVSEGSSVRLGADGSVIAANPARPMVAMASISFGESEGFRVEPIPDSAPPRIHGMDEEGEPLPEGADIAGAHVLGENEVASLGRFFLSMSPQSGFGRVIAYDPEAPAKTSFDGFRWYPANLDFQVKARWVPNPNPDEVTIATNRGLAKTFRRAGHFEFTVDGQSQRLVALSESPLPEEGDVLFVPFRDATTGKETYEIGRYMSVRFLGEAQEHTIDFNHATNPSCNYSPHFNCPLPPAENTLTVAIRAGEKTYPAH